MANHSKNFNRVRTYYKSKFWNKHQVENAVKQGWITAAEYEEITGEAYPAPAMPEEETAAEAAPAQDVAESVAEEEPEKSEEVAEVSEEEEPDSEE